VKSSLENLEHETLPESARVYVDRARSGLARLGAILTRMTEATRLEGALRDADRERFDLAAVVAGSVDGYRVAYPDVPFTLSRPAGVFTVAGAPDLCAQMLDKLVANAVEFSTGGPIAVALARDDVSARLAVANAGPPLPAGMEERLFESMVSVRAGNASGAPHLGLGLYIVRLIAQFHGGAATAENRVAPPGVAVIVRLPLAAA